MTTLTIQPTPADFSRIKPGDRITHMDSHRLGRPRVVAGRYDQAYRRLPLVNDRPGSPVEDYVYPGGLVGSTLTVERDEPQPAPAPPPAPKKACTRVTRTIDGLRLVSQGDSTWRTEDGHFEVRLGYDGLTFCEGPHPVRVTSEMRQWAQANSTRSQAQPILTAIRLGQRGYLCEGEVEHQSPDAWQVWDLSGSNVDPFEDTRFESFTEAAQALARHLHDKA